ncbi:glycosyltransferase [Candidatus Parcubacteria bacterium]|nr:MAG: glycosyltransferase [Candidatus Parcubacteria bacterium]
MNILFVISSLNYGGAEKQTVIDANLLSSSNNVFLIAFNDGPQKEQLKEKVHYIQLSKNGYIQTAKKLADICRKNSIKVIHTSLFAPSIISAISTIYYKTNLVWYFHSHEYDIPTYSKVAFVFFARFNTVKKIFFVSLELRDFLSRRFFLPKRKLGILYNTTSFVKEFNAVKKDSSKIIIGYVGRLVELKRVKYLVDLTEYLIAKKHENFEVWIVGNGEEMKNLQKSIEMKNLVDYIKLLGFHKETQKYYAKFDIFILPSREECLSIALIDAITSGVPSLAFDVGGNNEIIKHNENGFIVKNKEELFEKAELLIENSSLRTMFSTKALNISNSKFSQISRSETLNKISKDVLKT